MRKLAVFTLVSLSTAVFGCAPDTYESDESEELTAEAEGALVGPNAVAPNAVAPNAVAPNAVAPNAVAPNALAIGSLAPSVTTALQDPGLAGDLSRLHVKYLVSCAFTTEQSISFTWTDANSVPHVETYSGALALVPDWSWRGLAPAEERLITACMGARTNYYATTVLISMRGNSSLLAADEDERGAYTAREGAFWGNIFSTTPEIHSCYDTANRDNSRARLRECAAGHVDGATTVQCGPIVIEGDCSTMCTAPETTGDGFLSCGGNAEAITTFLPPPPPQ